MKNLSNIQINLIQTILKGGNRMEKKEFYYERKRVMDEWYAAHRDELAEFEEEDIYVDWEEQRLLEDYYMEIGLYNGRKKSKRPPRDENEEIYNNRGVKIMPKERDGVVKYVCERCGAEYDYEPVMCKELDVEFGIGMCGGDEFTIVHGPFEGVFMMNQDAIQCGSFQGLARHSIFEEGCNFSDVAYIDEAGIFQGYMSEDAVRKADIASHRWDKFGLEERAKVIAERNDVISSIKMLRDYVLEHFSNKISSIRSYKELKATQGFAKRMLSYLISRNFGEYGKVYAEGYVYPAVYLSTEEIMEVKLNVIFFNNFTHELYRLWSDYREIDNNKYQEAWNKWISLRDKELPENPYYQRDLIMKGVIDKELCRLILTHANYLRRTGQVKNPINYVVYKSMQKFVNSRA